MANTWGALHQVQRASGHCNNACSVVQCNKGVTDYKGVSAHRLKSYPLRRPLSHALITAVLSSRLLMFTSLLVVVYINNTVGLSRKKMKSFSKRSSHVS